MAGKILYSPIHLNKKFKEMFVERNWEKIKIKCQYSYNFYLPEFKNFYKNKISGAFREMDFVRENIGVEIQFGKYAFMVYNVCAKMTIFHRKGIIIAGIEIIPVKNFADKMSTGVSYFEQFVWDLEERGVSDIDIPVLIIGVDSEIIKSQIKS